ncbi:MAG: hypothetical protein C0507_21470 [Cyanobacteria bacterium PR.3.49]|jgi:hypothetical protein|nr:hypothetical protein [Cyanobacteria bacterium PR.3.49]
MKMMKIKNPIERVLTGVWHNQHNSQMQLEIDEAGKIAGYFISGVNTAGDPSDTYPLVGFARGDVFAFCVDFSNHGTMTTWVGQIIDPEQRNFQAMWQMVADVNQDKKSAWKSIWTGQDTFESGPRKSEVCARPKDASHPTYCSLV